MASLQNDGSIFFLLSSLIRSHIIAMKTVKCVLVHSFVLHSTYKILLAFEVVKLLTLS